MHRDQGKDERLNEGVHVKDKVCGVGDVSAGARPYSDGVAGERRWRGNGFYSCEFSPSPHVWHLSVYSELHWVEGLGKGGGTLWGNHKSPLLKNNTLVLKVQTNVFTRFSSLTAFNMFLMFSLSDVQFEIYRWIICTDSNCLIVTLLHQIKFKWTLFLRCL